MEEIETIGCKKNKFENCLKELYLLKEVFLVNADTGDLEIGSKLLGMIYKVKDDKLEISTYDKVFSSNLSNFKALKFLASEDGVWRLFTNKELALRNILEILKIKTDCLKNEIYTNERYILRTKLELEKDYDKKEEKRT